VATFFRWQTIPMFREQTSSELATGECAVAIPAQLLKGGRSKHLG